jgi:hypothetical protein
MKKIPNPINDNELPQKKYNERKAIRKAINRKVPIN